MQDQNIHFKVNLQILRFSRHFKCDSIFAVIVFLLNETIRWFNTVRNGRVKTTLQMIEF